MEVTKRCSFFVVLVVAMFFVFSNFGSVNAAPVSFETAQVVAENWMERVGEDRVVDEGRTLQNEGNSIGYLFSFSGGGFVVVPMDDTFEPVKAWSRRGHFRGDPSRSMDMETMVKKSFLRQKHFLVTVRASSANYQSSLTDAHEGWRRILSPGEVRAQESSQVVGPLLTTTWGQREPYNAYCPIDNDNGELSVTGCTSTAMAQILRYWRWPEAGTGSKCYSYCSNYDCLNNPEVTLCADFEHVYNWNKMPDILTESSPAEEIDTVATLMSDLGIIFETNYSSSGSGAFPYEDDFSTYLGYSDEVEIVYESWSSSYSTIKNQLDKGYPVFFCSSNHAYVADGFREDLGMNQTHFNFGWDGSSDGWYTIEGLNEFWGASYDSSSRVTMIINIYPDFITADSAPDSPVLEVVVNGTIVNCSWQPVTGATGYLFSYAPAPYTGPGSIVTVDWGSQTSMSANLWVGASYFVAIQAYNLIGGSEYSNIGLFEIR
ncbi:MAG: C10 family peptidase [Patescibacteria group bacterium]|nr:C10 family peptidase [Patescibacteria group bacterium]